MTRQVSAQSSGPDLRGCTLAAAAARIEDAIDIGFRGASKRWKPNAKTDCTRREVRLRHRRLEPQGGRGCHRDLMTELNHEAIEAEGSGAGLGGLEHSRYCREDTRHLLHPP